ncbi:NFX1-type zinc finger-containing protein 1-like [Mercenaria mercenaria]|uniref:NFX1-type zinc finger-containing protein 1-like n=1 Tax=Mercenaria mercenaria TaxID=6596 RepID=UPI00234EF91E|nr:NFX1-type zinc finger-containing protein 1-like [Mercenaria mercenaria]XP_053401224.1 NFX1-type zinc finger-containing protein 1-like [Mercenaria mercenaria]
MASLDDENNTGKLFPLPIYYENDGLSTEASIQGEEGGRGRGRGRPPLASRGRSRGRMGDNFSDDRPKPNNETDETNATSGTKRQHRGNLSHRGRVRGGRRGGTSCERPRRSKDGEFDLQNNEAQSARGRRPASHDRRPRDEKPPPNDSDSDSGTTQSVKSNSIKKPSNFRGNVIKFSQRDNPDEVLLDMVHSRSGFVEFIRKTPEPRLIYHVILLLCKISESTMLAYRRQILEEVEKSFLHNLTDLLNNISMKDKSTQSLWSFDDNLIRFLSNVSKLISVIITTLPSSLSKCKSVITALKEVRDEHNVDGFEDALKDVEEIFKREKEARQKTEEARESRKVRKVNLGGILPDFEDMGPPPDNFRDMSIFPTLGDLQIDEKPFLRANKAKGKYDDLDTYLDIQFRLLREDYVQPLRKGVTEYRNCIKEGIQVKRLRDIRLYHSVQILRPVCSGRGINHILQFDITYFKKMNWTSSRRLLYGSLVCLSKDNFENVFYATVTERDAKELSDGYIQVYFENKEDMLQILPNDVFVMAETTAYFEAFRYVLEGLQEMDDKMPLQRYLIDCETTLKPPKYLLHAGGPKYDFTCLLKEEEAISKFPVLNTPLWPSATDLGLDSSQYEAIQRAITKELAIIQGPPGTGKTYVGLKITQLLLNNTSYWKNKQECPILVVCYTNHALDQFLEGISQFTDGKIVRIGGRCKSDTLQPFILRNIKQSRKENRERSFRVMQSERDCRSQLRESERKIEHISTQLKKTSAKIISFSHLSQFMTDRQKVAFEVGRAEESLKDCLSEWLGVVGKHSVTESENGTEGDKFRRVWKLAILENVIELPNHEQNSVIDVWDLDLGRRAEIYKSWISELTENIRHQLHSVTGSGDQTDDKTNYLRTLVYKVHETILDVEILLKHVTKYITRQQVYTLIAGKVVSTDLVMMHWLKLTGKKKDIPSIRNALENIADNDGGHNQNEEIKSDDDDEDLEEQRQLDEDDDFLYDFDKTERKKKPKPIKNDGEWLVKFDERKMAHKIRNLLNSAKKFTTEKADALEDMWRLQANQRRDLYCYWVQMYRQKLKADVKTHEEEFNKATEKLGEVRDMETLEILKEADIMGMTTTGAAKYRKLLQSVLPKIIIVEEAAEVLESHIVTTLNSNCQHLILIGDHKQLRPSTTVYELSKKYSMDVSLFERMVRNDVPCVTLQEQHRMRPNISSLLRHKSLYPQLRDHENVLKYDNIKGVDENVQFIDHEEPEATQEDSTSYSNPHEAKFIAAMCLYFLNQGYAPEQITVITPYMGQVLLLRREMPKATFEGVRITAVDNFQGEENDIILLSLVRSSSYVERRKRGRNMIGFVGIENRICVSLSRAKKGLYVLGNFKLLEENSSMWSDMVHDMRNKGLVKSSVTLRCQNHSEQTVYAEKASDFEKVPNGGCKKPCDGKLPCGHRCPKSCHVIDSDHKKASCVMPCNKVVCEQGHKCTQQCWQKCGKCNTFVEKKIPMCDHKARMPCHMDPFQWKCKVSCDFLLPCGHPCNKTCHDCVSTKKHENVCQKEVTKFLPCKHTAKMKCFENVSAFVCKTPCNEVLNCKHKCSGTCGTCFYGRIHKGCKGTCRKRLPCGHECTYPCSDFCPPCRKPCGWMCSHGLLCKRKCWEECEQCRDKCNYKCKHNACEQECYEECRDDPCEERCMRKLKCGHLCSGLCGETCICIMCQSDYLRNDIGETFDSGSRFIQLPNCNCIFEVHRLELNLERETSSRHGDLCKHCPHCSKPITKDLKRYTNILKRARAKISDKFQSFVGSVNDRKREILKITREFQSLKSCGLTDQEIKRLLIQIDNPNNFGALHIATRKVEKLKQFLPIYNDVKNVESSGIAFTQAPEIENLVNPQLLRDMLIEGRKLTTKQFWDEVGMEIERLRLVMDLFLLREYFILKQKDNSKLNTLFQLVFEVLSNKMLNGEVLLALKSARETLQSLRVKDELDESIVTQLTVRLLYFKPDGKQNRSDDRTETATGTFHKNTHDAQFDKKTGQEANREDVVNSTPQVLRLKSSKRKTDDFVSTSSVKNLSEISEHACTETSREAFYSPTHLTEGAGGHTLKNSSAFEMSLGSDSVEPVKVTTHSCTDKHSIELSSDFEVVYENDFSTEV